MEEYRKISINPKYSVSNLGNVRNDNTGKVLKGQKRQGYYRVRLYDGSCDEYKTVGIHRLVAWAFPEICGEYKEGLQIDHLNTIRDDNRPENLRWVTPSENRLNPITNARFRASISGENHPMYGKHHTDEAKKKMSENHMGIPGFWKGKTLNEEHRKQLSLSHMGKHWRKENGVRVYY